MIESKGREGKKEKKKKEELCSEPYNPNSVRRKENPQEKLLSGLNFIASSSSCFEFQVIIELMLLLDGFFLDLELFRWFIQCLLMYRSCMYDV